MDDLLTISRPPLKARRPEVLPAALVAVLLAVLFAFALLTLQTPNMVRLTVDNPQAWRAEVSARAADSSSWTGAGAVARDGRLDFLQFPDQGSEWVIRFSYAGRSEEVAISRDDLAAADWTIEVPQELAEQLATADVAPTTGSSAGG